MPRPPIGKRAMTPAERQRRRRTMLAKETRFETVVRAVDAALKAGVTESEIDDAVSCGFLRYDRRINPPPPPTQEERRRSLGADLCALADELGIEI